MDSQQLALATRLLLAVVLGGLIGLERQLHGRPAGLRTHVLVCLGSTLVMILNAVFGSETDPGRAIAGIVTGVGFLGAGVIVKSHDIVRGLTTAACIWFVAALGIAIGQGSTVIALAGTGVGLLVLVLLDRVAHWLPAASYHRVVVGGDVERAEEIEAACRRELESWKYRVVHMSSSLDIEDGSIELVLRLRTRAKAGQRAIPSRHLLAIEGVTRVRWD